MTCWLAVALTCDGTLSFMIIIIIIVFFLQFYEKCNDALDLAAILWRQLPAGKGADLQ